MVAKIDIDLNAAVISAMNGNEAMQKVLTANPLIQTILFAEQSVVNDALQINPASIPNGATQAAQGNNMQAMNVTFPGGGQMNNVYGDARGVDDFQRQANKESMKGGKR